ncbi:MAG: carbohydrate kinase family protein [Candidatus Limnocylindrales bacterium]
MRASAQVPARNARIVVLGDLVLDVVVAPDGPLRPGTDVEGRVSFRQGGSAATTARWFARLGLETSFLTAVATDGLGDALVAYLERCEVVVHALRVPADRTGRLAVLVEEGERSFVSDRAAIRRLGPRFVQAGWFAGSALLHVPGYSLVGERLAAASRRAARLAQRAGALISVDLSSAGFLATEGSAVMLDRVAGLAPDVLLATRSETAAATGAAGVEGLLALAPLVVVKAGAAGASAYGRGSPAPVAVPAPPMRVADPTGAGDAFDAGFLASLVRTGVRPERAAPRDLRRALEAGHRAARREISGRRVEFAVSGLAETCGRSASRSG